MMTYTEAMEENETINHAAALREMKRHGICCADDIAEGLQVARTAAGYSVRNLLQWLGY